MSKELVKGFWWAVIGRYLLFGLIVALPILIVQFAGVAFISLQEVSISTEISIMLLGIITLGLSIFAQVLGYIYGFYMYEDLKNISKSQTPSQQ